MTPAASGELRTLTGRDPGAYEQHVLHSSERTYVETNCYTDILIELIHARGLEPLAVMGSTLRIDFEGDQWTFFKPRPEELEALYGIDIHEMQPYRPLAEQIEEQIEHGRSVIVELDSYWMPDTASTSYRREHVKSSVVAEAIDRESQRLRYFHGVGLYELEGEDYREILRVARELSPDVLPPFTELVRFDAGLPLQGEVLRHAARELTSRHLGARPRENPFTRFGEELERDLGQLLEGGAADYHAYAFATVRMAGSSFEVAATHLQWLLPDAPGAARDALGEIVDGCKALSFRLARRRAFEPEPIVQSLAQSWERAMGELEREI